MCEYRLEQRKQRSEFEGRKPTFLGDRRQFSVVDAVDEFTDEALLSRSGRLQPQARLFKAEAQGFSAFPAERKLWVELEPCRSHLPIMRQLRVSAAVMHRFWLHQLNISPVSDKSRAKSCSLLDCFVDVRALHGRGLQRVWWCLLFTASIEQLSESTIEVVCGLG